MGFFKFIICYSMIKLAEEVVLSAFGCPKRGTVINLDAGELLNATKSKPSGQEETPATPAEPGK